MDKINDDDTNFKNLYEKEHLLYLLGKLMLFACSLLLVIIAEWCVYNMSGMTYILMGLIILTIAVTFIFLAAFILDFVLTIKG